MAFIPDIKRHHFILLFIASIKSKLIASIGSMLGSWDLKNDVYYFFIILVFIPHQCVYVFTESIFKKKKKAFETFEAKMESCNLLIVS